MKTVMTVVGARPQFIKAAPVSKLLRRQAREILVHTGQHYDANMSELFFAELEIPEPDFNLGIGSGLHGEQTGRMLVALEKLLQEHKPDWMLVYGDTNSTLAGALAASKLHIPVAHVEAGLRSFNRTMPEEINRILTDRMADLLFCPTTAAIHHLQREGIVRGVYLTGDVMMDAALHFSALAESKTDPFADLGIDRKGYCLLTCHRPQNTDDPQVLGELVDAFLQAEKTLIFPVHPRTRKMLSQFDFWQLLQKAPHIRLIEPVGYLEMIQLEKQAEMIITDSGGVQKEAYFFGVPCITLRSETEWVETVQDGWNLLVGHQRERILDALNHFQPAGEQARHYGDGHASEKIVDLILNDGHRSP